MRRVTHKESVLVGALVTLACLVAGAASAAGADAECVETTVIAPVEADSWVDLDSPLANKGSDAVLDVGESSRALLRFTLPAAVPPGCALEGARLRVYADSGTEGTRVEALALGSGWTESAVDWENQPAAVGAPAPAWSRDGYMAWNVTSQVRAMFDGGANHGFALRDALEGTEFAGGHGFYSREKGEFPPELVIRFAAPPSGEPAPPAPPEPAAVTCGQLITKSTLVTNDLTECLGDGLVIGAPRIILDLGGHTIDGTGLATGVRNEGYSEVTVRNGTVQEFDYGVQLFEETTLTAVEGLTLRNNQLAAVELFDAGAGNEIRSNTLESNGEGIQLVSGTVGTVVADNTMTVSSGAAIMVRDSDANRLERNRVVGGGDLGIGLERAGGNVVLGNVVSGTSDGGVMVTLGSHGNRVEGNDIADTGDTGIKVLESDRNEVVSNETHGMSDAGIALQTANDGVVSDNDVGSNPGGIQMDGSSRNLVERNDASFGGGIGIELGGGSYGNTLRQNVANANGAQGIYIGDESLIDPLGLDPGNLLDGNTANGNGADGITVAKGGHTLVANVARDNRGRGINAAMLNTDGGRNAASGNFHVEQCLGVFCKAEWNPPVTTITEHPPAATRGTSATFRFAATDDTTDVSALRFECRLDDAAFAGCSSPQSYSGLSTGTYVFEVRAIDLAGNVEEPPARFAWSIDSTPPETAIDAAPPASTRDTTASFAFSADEPESTFECSLDGAPFTACASPNVYAGLSSGDHTFRVRATDLAGNTDPTPAGHAWAIDSVPPETTIDSGPRDPTNSTSASFEFSADEPGSSFECSLDGAPFAPCASPAEYTSLPGTHTFRVRATDAAGNTDPTPAEYSWTIDTTPPETTIDDGPDEATNSRSAAFELSSDEPGSTFACSLDGAEFGACGEYTGLSDGTHTFRVQATDRAGNTDPTPAEYSWTIDATPPETTIDDGPDDPTNSTSATFEFSSDEPGSTFECALDDGPYGACADYHDLSPGEHTFSVRATDRAGNTDPTPATYTWTIDTTAPETTIDAGPDAITNRTTAGFSFSADEAASFECALDGAEFGPCGEYTDLGEGEHSFQVRATDRAGNTDPTPATYTWTVDTTAPETTIDDGPDDPTNSTSATFEFSSNEAGSTFECALDDGPFGACSDYHDLEPGEHTFSVRATDRAGNTDPTPATYTWTIDTTAPETTIDAGPDDPTNSTSAAFEFSSNEAGSTFECSLDGAAFVACVSPREYGGLAGGGHTFRVRATDRVGNADPTPAVHTWTIDDAPADTTPPQTAIGSAPADPSNGTSASFEFSSDEAGSTFECSLDNAAFAACVTPRLYTGLSSGAHSFRVRAIDAAGNVDATPASHGWTIDTTAPNTTIGTGPPALTTSPNASFTFTSTETGATFECSLDNAAFSACTTPHQLTGVADGAHTLRVRAVDRAGNADATPATRSWTVDSTPPNTTIGNAPLALTNSTSASFTFTSSESGSTFECSLDNAAFVACTTPRQHTNLAAGSHSFRVRARDAAGNTDPTPATHSWTIDTSAPSTTIGNGPPAQTSSTSATFEFSSNDAAATFECSLDNTAFAACTSPRQLTGLAPGTHNFRVRARDGAGNLDATPAAHNWAINAPQGCTTTTLTANADAWIDQNSPTANKGDDSILKVQSKGPNDNFRAVVRFALPTGLPQGCTFSSATLRLFTASSKPSRTIQALRVMSAWTENAVNWTNQPATAGAAAATASGSGYREWNVTEQVQAMLAPGANHGFLIRDAVENADSEQQFHSREKGQNPPQLVIRFAGVS